MKKPRHFNEEAAEPCDLFDNTDLVIEKLCQHYGLDPEEAEEIIKPAAPKKTDLKLLFKKYVSTHII